MNTKEIVKRIQELIGDDGYTAYHKLDSDHKNELVALCIRAYGSDAYDFIVEDEETLDGLIGYLLNGTRDAAEALAESMQHKARLYFEKQLEEMFDECYGEVEHERKLEAGLTPIVDRINGEIRWVR